MIHYIGISYESSMFHHGVKGMKWGVRKTYSKSGKERRKKYFEYEKLNRKGELVKKSYRISNRQMKSMRQRGLINSKGDLMSDEKKQAAADYIKSRKVVKGLTLAAIPYTAVNLAVSAPFMAGFLGGSGASGAVGFAGGALLGGAINAAGARAIGEAVGGIVRSAKNVPVKNKTSKSD